MSLANKVITVLVGLFCLIGTCIAAQPGEGEELCRLENEAGKAYVAHDRKFLDSLFAEEFIHTNYRGGTVDKAAELDFFSSSKLTMKSAVVDNCKVHKYGHVAVVTGTNTWIETIYNGVDLSGVYRFTRVYVWRQRRWQIVASHFSKSIS